MHLRQIPVPGAPDSIRQQAWRVLGDLSEFCADPIDALLTAFRPQMPCRSRFWNAPEAGLAPLI